MLPSSYPQRADHPRHIVTAAPSEVATHCTVRPTISARLFGSGGGRSRGERTGFAISAKTTPVWMGGGVGLTEFAPEAPTLISAMNLAALNVGYAVGAWRRQRP
jgi:hypothetical protein